jgi:hypothetical protein
MKEAKKKKADVEEMGEMVIKERRYMKSRDS